MPRVNIQLLDEVLDYIIDHPDEWDQGSWFDNSAKSACGTTACFAGHALKMTGHEIVMKRDEDGDWDSYLDGEPSGWETKGAEELGLTPDESYRLFLGTLGPYTRADEKLQREQYQLKNVKVEVERIRARAKAQEAAFNRIAQEFIDAAGLDDVVKPGYRCPESEEVMQGITGGARE